MPTYSRSKDKVLLFNFLQIGNGAEAFNIFKCSVYKSFIGIYNLLDITICQLLEAYGSPSFPSCERQ